MVTVLTGSHPLTLLLFSNPQMILLTHKCSHLEGQRSTKPTTPNKAVGNTRCKPELVFLFSFSIKCYSLLNHTLHLRWNLRLKKKTQEDTRRFYLHIVIPVTLLSLQFLCRCKILISLHSFNYRGLIQRCGAADLHIGWQHCLPPPCWAPRLGTDM